MNVISKADLRVVGMADADACDIGDEIARHNGLQAGRGSDHSRSTADHISGSHRR